MQYCLKVRKKAQSTNRYNQAPNWPKTTYGKVTNQQENITYRRAQRLAFSQQVTTRLLGTEKTVWQRQTQNEKKDIHIHIYICLGTVS